MVAASRIIRILRIIKQSEPSWPGVPGWTVQRYNGDCATHQFLGSPLSLVSLSSFLLTARLVFLHLYL